MRSSLREQGLIQRVKSYLVLFFISIILLLVSAMPIMANSLFLLTQEVKPPDVTIRTERNDQSLEEGKSVKQEIKAGEVHTYRLTLTAGQLVHAVINQLGIDVQVKLFNPDGKQVIEVDSPNGINGPEPVWVLAEMSGSYNLEVLSLDVNAQAGQYEIRIEELRAASQQDRYRVAVEHEFSEAETLLAQGKEQSWRRAIEKYETCLNLWRTLRNLPQEAATLNKVGLVYNLLSEKQNAIKYFKQALPIFQTLKDQLSEATTLYALGLAHYSTGDSAEALQYYDQALPIFHALNIPSHKATTLNDMGAAYASLSDSEKALKYYDQALTIRRALKDQSGEAVTLGNIGAVYDLIGQKQNAIKHYDQALSIAQKTNNLKAQAATLNNIGHSYYSIGMLQESFEHYAQALSIFQTLKDRSGEAHTRSNIGTLYASLGDWRNAFDYFNQALKTFQLLHERSGEAVTLNNIGIAHEWLVSLEEAVKYYKRALSIFQEINNLDGQAFTLNNIGYNYLEMGDWQEALKNFDKAMVIFRSLGNRLGEAGVLNNMGQALDSSGKPQECLEFMDRALKIYQSLGDRANEANVLGNLGVIYETVGNKEKAFDSYQQAIVILEGLRASATIEEIRARLSEYGAYIYKACSWLMHTGQYVRAFNLIELARARMFLDKMGSARWNILKTKKAYPIANELVEIESELNSLEQRVIYERNQKRDKPPSVLTNEIISSLETQYAAKQRQYEDLILRFKLTNPEQASLQSISTLSLPEVQKLLDKDVTLLSYFNGPEKTLAFVITRDSFRAVEIPVKEADIRRTITWFHWFTDLSNPQSASLNQLYNWLIAPLKQYIKTTKVGIIPHGVLHYVPFAALTDGRSYFGSKHTLFHLPSASALRFIQQKRKPIGTKILALSQNQAKGFPFLPYADYEVKTVASIYNTQALKTGEASKSVFLKRAKEYNIIHIAAHTEFTANPLFSRILLTPDKSDTGALEVRDIYNLELPKASLVVLSACETEIGTRSKGDDVISLTRAFIYAGAPTIISSLWIVDDEATSYLMKSFYTHLKNGMSKAESLKAAQSYTRKKYPHPYYWAAFVLTGDSGR